MNVQPTEDRVLLKRQKSDAMSPGGIVIPDAVQKKSALCVVVAVGPGKKLDSGGNGPMFTKPGDVVMLSQWRGNEVTIDDEPMLIVKEAECEYVYEK